MSSKAKASEATCDALGCEKAGLHCCSVCGVKKYCCSVCQKADWKAGHKAACSTLSSTAEKDRKKVTVKSHIFLNDGALYDGETLKGLPHGFGTAYLQIDQTHDRSREWMNYGYHGDGEGMKENPSGRPYYRGQWKGGEMHGQGSVIYPSGIPVYEGNY